MHYPVVIHKDKDSDYGITVPDLPGCFSGGTTVDEALAMAREAIELHLEGLIEDGGVVPHASSIERLQADRDFAGGTWAIVSVDESSLRIGYARVGVTMPQRVLDAVDRFAKESGETRSGLLARAAIQYIGRDARELPEGSRGGSKLRSLRTKTGASSSLGAPSESKKKGQKRATSRTRSTEQADTDRAIIPADRRRASLQRRKTG